VLLFRQLVGKELSSGFWGQGDAEFLRGTGQDGIAPGS